jgi:hypothetical protein
MGTKTHKMDAIPLDTVGLKNSNVTDFIEKKRCIIGSNWKRTGKKKHQNITRTASDFLRLLGTWTK